MMPLHYLRTESKMENWGIQQHNNDTIDQFRPTLRAIIDQNGRHIEHLFK